MADLDKVTLPSGSTYNLKDTQARQDIETLKATAVGAVHYLGVTTTALSDGSETNPITIGELTVTAKNGDFVIYDKLELVFSSSDNKWHEYGSTGSLKALAFKDSATGKITPAGSVSQPTFTGNAGNVSVTGTPSGSVSIKTGTGTANYIPSGTISAPAASASVNTTTVNSITDVGILPKLTMSVQNETLTFGWDPGTLPTKGVNQTVVTGVKEVSVEAPTFTGAGVDLEATFTGTAVTSTVTFTPSGTISKPTFTGAESTVTVS